ncbi:hypothetical protein GL213_04000 [Halogeometricum borinquense]|uniref:DUF7993 domain-containing protein n=1 Tax=Halogeometricum borinquense TaxID=60847 RepID=A0A6C0UIN4_9EURY|nr:hypothetical protein [Halogeometricum borinquense]QIB75295.1 hypothetical protein G3I44_13960 [Halogeometricum borinquense]QIQ75760.1 hypothetical protein GL213_04000 [Halogeometricum borinquense]
MVEDRLSHGKRIAQLLASEVTGHERSLSSLSVTDSDPDVEPTDDGAFAYAIEHDGEQVAEVFVQPDRARVEFVTEMAAVADVAEQEGLRVRPKAVKPARTLVFVENGAQVKWLLPALRVVATE